MTIIMASKVGVFFHCCCFEWDLYRRRGNAEQVVAWWRCPVASGKALDILHGVMCTILHPCLHMACRKPPRYVPYKCTYVPYNNTFGASDQRSDARHVRWHPVDVKHMSTLRCQRQRRHHLNWQKSLTRKISPDKNQYNNTRSHR